jgi:hypothetical protein
MLTAWVAPLLLAAAVAATPPRAMTPREQLLDMSWLAGTWQSKDFVTTYTLPEGGTLMSVSRYFKDGRTTFFEFEHFAVTDSAVVLTPFPGGKRSVSFRMVDYDPARRRAVFENPAHDFPKQLVYQRAAKDSLYIDLSGDENGAYREEHFRLHERR